jgi:ATP-binding cassette subfamily G (WHITE) protein 2 (SNQ2)
VVLGDRLINGQPLPADFQLQTYVDSAVSMAKLRKTFRGYCQQTDTHLPQATVREAILSSAHLRQSEWVPMEEIQAQYVFTLYDQ